MSDGGKGSRPRPFSVSQQEYDSRWDAIFGRDLKKEQPTLENIPKIPIVNNKSETDSTQGN